MDNYLLMGHILQCKVIPKEKIHPELWVGANKKWKKVPIDRLERIKHDKVCLLWFAITKPLRWMLTMRSSREQMWRLPRQRVDFWRGRIKRNVSWRKQVSSTTLIKLHMWASRVIYLLLCWHCLQKKAWYTKCICFWYIARHQLCSIFHIMLATRKADGKWTVVSSVDSSHTHLVVRPETTLLLPCTLDGNTSFWFSPRS